MLPLSFKNLESSNKLEDRIGWHRTTDAAAAADRDDPHWASLHAAAEPSLDASGGPTLQVGAGGEVARVGIARANILSVPEGFEFAAGLVKARLREELKSTAARKTARADVESDLALLQQLLALQPGGLASTGGSAGRPHLVRSRPPVTDSFPRNFQEFVMNRSKPIPAAPAAAPMATALPKLISNRKNVQNKR